MLYCSDWNCGYTFHNYDPKRLNLKQLAEDINDNARLPLKKERYGAQNAVSDMAHEIITQNGSRWVELGIGIGGKRIWLNADHSYISNGQPGTEIEPINKYVTTLYYVRAMRNWFYGNRTSNELWKKTFVDNNKKG